MNATTFFYLLQLVQFSQLCLTLFYLSILFTPLLFIFLVWLSPPSSFIVLVELSPMIVFYSFGAAQSCHRLLLSWYGLVLPLSFTLQHNLVLLLFPFLVWFSPAVVISFSCMAQSCHCRFFFLHNLFLPLFPFMVWLNNLIQPLSFFFQHRLVLPPFSLLIQFSPAMVISFSSMAQSCHYFLYWYNLVPPSSFPFLAQLGLTTISSFRMAQSYHHCFLFWHNLLLLVFPFQVQLNPAIIFCFFCMAQSCHCLLLFQHRSIQSLLFLFGYVYYLLLFQHVLVWSPLFLFLIQLSPTTGFYFPGMKQSCHHLNLCLVPSYHYFYVFGTTQSYHYHFLHWHSLILLALLYSLVQLSPVSFLLFVTTQTYHRYFTFSVAFTFQYSLVLLSS